MIRQVYTALLAAGREVWAASARTRQYSPAMAYVNVASWLIPRREPRAPGTTVDWDGIGGLWQETRGEQRVFRKFTAPLDILPPSARTTASAQTLEFIHPGIDHQANCASSQSCAPPQSCAPRGDDLAARARSVAMAFFTPKIAPPQRPAAICPLQIDCYPTRFTLTLRQATLRYRLRVSNRAADAQGPLIVRADLATPDFAAPGSENAEPGIRQHHHVAFDPDSLPVCHRLDGLALAGRIEITGVLRLPRAGIAAIRVGKAQLLVPLIRVSVESAGDSPQAIRCSECFALGVSGVAGGQKIKPLRLNSALRSWRKLTARRLHSAN